MQRKKKWKKLTMGMTKKMGQHYNGKNVRQKFVISGSVSTMHYK